MAHQEGEGHPQSVNWNQFMSLNHRDAPVISKPERSSLYYWEPLPTSKLEQPCNTNFTFKRNFAFPTKKHPSKVEQTWITFPLTVIKKLL